MKQLVILAAFALAMGTGGAVMACPTGGCATDEPIVTTPPQDCSGYGCARPEPAPLHTADCTSNGCVVPEPAPFQTACNSAGCAVPEPAPFQTADCGASNCAVPEPVVTGA